MRIKIRKLKNYLSNDRCFLEDFYKEIQNIMKKHSNLYKRKLKSIEKNVLEATVVEEDVIYKFVRRG